MDEILKENSSPYIVKGEEYKSPAIEIAEFKLEKGFASSSENWEEEEWS
ncbi:MAG: hypothetical protein AB9922_11705 [Bacteroidales bacterium]